MMLSGGFTTLVPGLTTEGSTALPLLFAVAFVWLALAIGRRLLIVLGAFRQGTAAERGIIAVGLGAGALQYVPFALGSVGLLGTRALRLTAGLIALAMARDLVGVATAAAKALRGLGRPSNWMIAWIIALLPAVVVAGLLALAPTTDPDGLAYHLTVPKRWLQSGWLSYLPTYPYSNAPMGVEMLFAWALAIAGDVGAKCVHFALGTLGAVGLYLAGRRLAGAMVGAVASTLYLVGPAGVSEVLGSAYVEGAAAFAMISAALAWLLWFQSGEQGCLRCAALLSGVAVSFKITAALLPAALFALTCIASIHRARESGRRSPIQGALLFSARILPLMLAPIVPWLARSALVTGNPVFPLFARLIPSRDFSPELSAKFDRFNRYMTWGNVVGRDWSIERRTWVLLGACTVVVLLGSLAIFRMRSWMARGTAVVLTVALVAQLSAAGLYVRYSIPLAAVLALPIAAAFAPALSRSGVAVGWVALTFIGSFVHARRSLAQADAGVGELVRVALGLEERRAFLLRHVGLYPLYEEVNRELPQDASVMLSCYCGGFYIDRTTFCADMVQNSLRVTSWDDFTSDLRRLGITHVIAPTVLATGGPSPSLDGSSTSSITRESQYRVVRPLLTSHARVRGTSSDQSLYELDPTLVGAR